jgi:colanic acid biosynthesis glycosyl transferase WcaI
LRSTRIPSTALVTTNRLDRRTRLLVFNQYYWPGVEATANLLTDLCCELAQDFDVTVVTGMVRSANAPAGRDVRDGVEIIRVRSTAFDRRRLGLRALNYVTYLVRSLAAGARCARPDIVLSMTDPPVIGDVALLVARRFRVPLVVVSQDVFPETAVALGRLQSRSVVLLLRALVGYYLRRADRIVAIGETMRARLEAKGADPDRISVIPNWVDTSAIEPAARDNAWAQRHGLDRGFVVMHSGNVGHAQDIDSLIRATALLGDLDDLTVAIVGGGARYAELVELAKGLEADRVRFFPYQPRDVLSQLLSSADVHVVGLASGLAGYVVPSRLYGILSVARPVIVAADAESETAQLVQSVGCGLVVRPGRPDLLAAAIRRAHAGELDLEDLGRRGRDYVVAEADRPIAMARYRALLTGLATSSR